jgi:hypothetical protein
VKSLDLGLINSMFLFAVLFERLFMLMFLHSTDVIIVVKVNVRIVLFLGNQLML